MNLDGLHHNGTREEGPEAVPWSKIILSEFVRLSDAEKQRRIQELEDAVRQPINRDLEHIDAEIAVLELRYQMSSDTMLRRLRDNKIDDTPDICRWHTLVEIRDRVVQAE
jgi:hypothetical protein